jgi:transposase
MNSTMVAMATRAGVCQAAVESPSKLKAIVQAAWAAVKRKDTYLHAQFHRIRARREAKKAILAVAASILTAAYHIMKNGTTYQDLGPDYFQRHDRHRTAHRLVQRLQHMGYIVQLQPAA